MHIDATFVPLRPGLALSNRVRVPLVKEQIEMFKKNDWEIVECTAAAHDKKAPLSFCSVWLSMNILVLDPKTICVEEQETAQMEQFDKLGFEVIPVPFWDVLLHLEEGCIARRRMFIGKALCKDYFPQIPGIESV